MLRPGSSADAQPSLREVRLSRDGGGWRLALHEEAGDVSAPVGTGAWATNLDETGHGATGVPAAVSGGWTDDDTFRADVVFLETPHRLELTGSRGEGTFELRWQTSALRSGRLADLRMPRSAEPTTTALLR